MTVKRVRPWNELTVETISWRSGWPRSAWTFRASLSMTSLASAPLLQKKARRAKGVTASSASASSIWRGTK